jgi:hypothetical protein
MTDAKSSLTVLSRLATSLGRRDDVPNQELAAEIVVSNDDRAVTELVDNLSNKDESIASDCIKTLYEIGERNPRLITKHTREFGRLLGSKNNRLVWGGMTALDAIAKVDPRGVHNLLGEIMAATERGSVITRDHAVGILVKLASSKEHKAEALKLLLDQLEKCPDNQFPMYAEMSEVAFKPANSKALSNVLRARLKVLKKESQRRRVEKVLGRLS